MVLGDEFSRRKKFRSNFRVENLASDSNSSSDGETNSQKLSGVRGKRKIKTFPELVHETSTNTRKLEEETSALLRDLDSLRNQNLYTCRRLQRIQKLSCAVKQKMETFTINQTAVMQQSASWKFHDTDPRHWNTLNQRYSLRKDLAPPAKNKMRDWEDKEEQWEFTLPLCLLLDHVWLAWYSVDENHHRCQPLYPLPLKNRFTLRGSKLTITLETITFYFVSSYKFIFRWIFDRKAMLKVETRRSRFKTSRNCRTWDNI